MNPTTLYSKQKSNAKSRSINFTLTFEEWWDIWQQSGKWEERGKKKGQYVMSRKGDTGPYAIGNVFIQTCNQNCREANKGKPGTFKGRILSEEHRRKLSEVKKGKPGRVWTEEQKLAAKGKILSEETRKKISESLKNRKLNTSEITT
jgi:hypothetical protein